MDYNWGNESKICSSCTTRATYEVRPTKNMNIYNTSENRCKEMRICWHDEVPSHISRCEYHWSRSFTYSPSWMCGLQSMRSLRSSDSCSANSSQNYCPSILCSSLCSYSEKSSKHLCRSISNTKTNHSNQDRTRTLDRSYHRSHTCSDDHVHEEEAYIVPYKNPTDIGGVFIRNYICLFFMNMIIGASMRAMIAAIQSSGPVLVAVICFGVGDTSAEMLWTFFWVGAETTTEDTWAIVLGGVGTTAVGATETSHAL